GAYAESAEAVTNSLDVCACPRHHIAVNDRCGPSFVLAVLRRYSARGGHGYARVSHDDRNCFFVLWVCVGVEKANGDRFGAAPNQFRHHISHLTLVERDLDVAMRVDTFRNFQAHVSTDERAKIVLAKVEQRLAAHSSYFENVTEAAGCDDAHLRPCPLDNLVC